MNALSTQTSFRNAAAGIMAAMALTTMPFAAANDAQAQQPQQLSNSHSVETLRATKDSHRWSANNPRGVAVAVYLGTASPAKKDKIESVLRSDLSKHGIDEVAFFFEQNDQPNTVLLLVHNGLSGDFYDLTDGPNGVRSNIQAFARKVNFDKNIGQTLAATR